MPLRRCSFIRGRAGAFVCAALNRSAASTSPATVDTTTWSLASHTQSTGDRRVRESREAFSGVTLSGSVVVAHRWLAASDGDTPRVGELGVCGVARCAFPNRLAGARSAW